MRAKPDIRYVAAVADNTEETKECNTTTYLAAVVADIAVPPSSASREFMHFCL